MTGSCLVLSTGFDVDSSVGFLERLATVATADRVAEIIMENHAVGVVVGHPLNMNGTIGPRAERAEQFAELLRERLPNTEVILFDERMTTMAAARYLNETNTRGSKRKSNIDALSAQIILQNYLDMEKNAKN